MLRHHAPPDQATCWSSGIRDALGLPHCRQAQKPPPLHRFRRCRFPANKVWPTQPSVDASSRWDVDASSRWDVAYPVQKMCSQGSPQHCSCLSSVSWFSSLLLRERSRILSPLSPIFCKDGGKTHNARLSFTFALLLLSPGSHADVEWFDFNSHESTN